MPKGFQTGPYEVMFYLAMKDGPAYGYQLAARFRKMTGGHIKVSYGTIYPFLRRMERNGIIRSHKDNASGRVYYQLTQRGIESQNKMLRKIHKSRKQWEEKLLGILSLHVEVFGRRALTELLKQMR
ncbi:MAG TPA: PadR family transcriptional regulator [Candidatus Acidoferrum sp.]|nr:PadR family transcriptional regulator [Candidatus Acidoferrum sp.]